MAHENETTGYTEKGQTLGSVLRQVFTSPETHPEASVSRLRGDHRGRVGERPVAGVATVSPAGRRAWPAQSAVAVMRVTKPPQRTYVRLKDI